VRRGPIVVFRLAPIAGLQRPPWAAAFGEEPGAPEGGRASGAREASMPQTRQDERPPPERPIVGPLSRTEVRRQVERLPWNKAPGPCGVPAEAWRALLTSTRPRDAILDERHIVERRLQQARAHALRRANAPDDELHDVRPEHPEPLEEQLQSLTHELELYDMREHILGHVTGVFNKYFSPAAEPEQAWDSATGFDEKAMDAEVVLLYKGKGDRADPASYRPIALLRSLFKLYQSCVQVRFARFAELHPGSLAEAQSGFRPKRACHEQILALEYMKALAAQKKRPLYVTLLDLSKAFDSAAPEHILDAMAKSKLPPQLILAAKSELTFPRSIRMRVGAGTLTEAITVDTGVPQGGVLSPIYFAYFMNALAATCEQHSDIKSPDPADPHRFSVLMYADDTCLLAHSHSAMQQMLCAAHMWSVEVQASFNASKTEFFVSGDIREALRKDTVLRLGGVPLTRSPSSEGHRYLGVMVNGLVGRPGAATDLSARTSAMRKGVAASRNLLRPPGQRAHSGLACRFGRDLIMGKFMPALLYGCAVHWLAQRTIQLMKNQLSAALRICVSVPAYVPTTLLRIELGIYSVESHIAFDVLHLARWLAQHPVRLYRGMLEHGRREWAAEKQRRIAAQTGDRRARIFSFFWRLDETLEQLGLPFDALMRDMPKAEWKALVKRRMILRESSLAMAHKYAGPTIAARRQIQTFVSVDEQRTVHTPFYVRKRVVQREDKTKYETWSLQCAPYLRNAACRELAAHGVSFKVGYRRGGWEKPCPWCGEVGKVREDGGGVGGDTPVHVWECSRLPSDLRERIAKVNKDGGWELALLRHPDAAKSAALPSVLRVFAEIRLRRAQVYEEIRTRIQGGGGGDRAASRMEDRAAAQGERLGGGHDISERFAHLLDQWREIARAADEQRD
jgi:hypothetical protein